MMKWESLVMLMGFSFVLMSVGVEHVWGFSAKFAGFINGFGMGIQTLLLYIVLVRPNNYVNITPERKD